MQQTSATQFLVEISSGDACRKTYELCEESPSAFGFDTSAQSDDLPEWTSDCPLSLKMV